MPFSPSIISYPTQNGSRKKKARHVASVFPFILFLSHSPSLSLSHTHTHIPIQARTIEPSTTVLVPDPESLAWPNLSSARIVRGIR